MNLPLTTEEFLGILKAILEAKEFNKHLKTVSESINKTELAAESQKRIEELEVLLNSLKEYYLEVCITN
jgi:hypothetical protein